MHSLVKEQKKNIFTVPFLGPSGGTKNETAKSQNQQQRPTRPNKNTQKAYKKTGGSHMRSLISIDFPAQKRNLKARMWYQLSPFTGYNVAIAMQHDPGNIQHQDKSFSS
jgi:hypothetical protein